MHPHALRAHILPHHPIKMHVINTTPLVKAKTGKGTHSAQYSACNGVYVKLYTIPNRNIIAMEAFAPATFLLPFLPTIGAHHKSEISDVRLGGRTYTLTTALQP